MDRSDIGLLFDDNGGARRRVSDACAAFAPDQILADTKSSFGSVRDTLAHLYGAERVIDPGRHGSGSLLARTFDHQPARVRDA